MTRGYHTWYDPRANLCLTPTEKARQQALSYGLAPTQVMVAGQPVALKFTAKPERDKRELRRKLGLDLNRPTILLVGGGEGVGPIFDIAQHISQQTHQAQLVIVAGRNQSLKKKLDAAKWKIPVKVFGFVDNMPELMRAADVFVTKAGPGCIAEAFVAKLPLILFDYIPGQEETNVDYVVNHNAGAYVTDPQKIATLLSEWLTPGNPQLNQMTQNASRLAHPDAALTIARQIYQHTSISQGMTDGKQEYTPAPGFFQKYRNQLRPRL
jgi:1,2-diacylglycerol 3-beta-galactosyltransferase